MAGNSNAGRKTKLTEELIEEIYNYISNGLSNIDSCIMCNIAETTFYDWLKRGRNDTESQNDTIYAEFSKAIKKAEIQFKETHINNIQKASKGGSWQASAWLMERKHFKEWGNKQHIDHGGSVEVQIDTIQIPERNLKGKDDD